MCWLWKLEGSLTVSMASWLKHEPDVVNMPWDWDVRPPLAWYRGENPKAYGYMTVDEINHVWLRMYRPGMICFHCQCDIIQNHMGRGSQWGLSALGWPVGMCAAGAWEWVGWSWLDWGRKIHPLWMSPFPKQKIVNCGSVEEVSWGQACTHSWLYTLLEAC